jgi:integrase
MAERELTKAHRDLDTDSFTPPTRQSLAEYLTSWLDTRRSLTVTAGTLADYRSRVSRDLIPTLGHVRLDRLTGQQIQSLYSDLSKKGLSARTVRYTHGILRHALKDAVIQRILNHNPTDHVDLPCRVRREMAVLSPQQVNRLLAATAGDTLHALWAILILTGVRPGEALALRWEDVAGDSLRIARALKKDVGYTYVIGPPKTASGRRTLTLGVREGEALAAHRTRQASAIIAAGPRYARLGFIFTNAVGKPLDIAKVRREFKKALVRAKLPAVRLYDTRHTHATLLMSSGTSPRIVADRLGHSDISMTLGTYTHVLPGHQAEAVSRLDQLLTRAAV